MEPEWHAPTEDLTRANTLKIYNTLTKKKDKFIPATGPKNIRWYSCGPTVYDAAHMGHARNYVSTDIIRRILQYYFNYHVQFIMNITDIDDKIIVRARHKHLLSQHRLGLLEALTSNPAACLKVHQELEQFWRNWVSDILPAKLKQLVNVHEDSVESIIDTLSTTVQRQHQQQLGQGETDPKWAMNWKILMAAGSFVAQGKECISKESVDHILSLFSDIIGPQLDAKYGADLSHPVIFRELSAYWEEEFFKDMDRLDVSRPTVLTRVSEYIPEIINCIEQIMANGYGYERNGSVYFDTVAFQKNHFYAKLCPTAVNNTKLLEEGEGALSLGERVQEKKCLADFALWKKSKPGEPAWNSPWGKGRPGWHIECSAMAGSVAPGVLDIHSGGIDLAFPHHDNELAQSEAQYDCRQWVNYFIHMGHLHIDGQKMSKSLKNFITIDEALQRYSSRQMRLLFLLHSWSATLDYKESSMKEALSFEKLLMNFFDEVNALIAENQPFMDKSTGTHHHHQPEMLLSAHLVEAQKKVDLAMCDSFDTPSVLKAVQELIGQTRQYIQSVTRTRPLSTLLLREVGVYITRLFKIFGVIPDVGESTIGLTPISSSSALAHDNNQQSFIAAVKLASSIRDQVRRMAIESIQTIRESSRPQQNTYDISEDITNISLSHGLNAGQSIRQWQEILAFCDALREQDFFDLGVLLEDREDQAALVKLVDKEAIQKIRQEQRKRDQEQKERKVAAAELTAKRHAEKLAKASVHPSDLFKSSEYSKFDERGIPTHDASGTELSKNLRKKLIKEYEHQAKLYQEATATTV